MLSTIATPKRMVTSVWRKLSRLWQMIRDPEACGSRVAGRMTVGYVPWWPSNPYQVRLKQELGTQGIDVCDPRLDLRALLCLLLRRDQMDVVHIHWPHGMYLGRSWRFLFVVFYLWLCRLLKNNIIWTVHELEFYESRYPILDRVMVSFLMRVCRLLLVHSDYSAELIQERYRFPRVIKKIRHPSYVECYRNEIAREAARVQLGLGEARTVYLYMGHIKPYKGVEDLIETFITIRDDASRLLIVGKPLDDEIGNRVRNLAASDRRIVLELCYVPDDRVQVFMNAADVVVFPFQKIHTSGSILLAMSFGKPVIAPAIASIPEYVNGQSGILFEPTDPEALRAALMSARGRDLAAMGKAGYERVAGRSWAEFASCHAEVYAGLRSPRP